MRRYLGRLLVLASLVIPLAAAGGILAVQAQTPATITMTATGDPKLTGSYTITQVGTNQAKIDVTVNNLKPNDDRASHIHSPGSGAGACDSGGPVVYPLNDVKADASGKGTASTTITIDPAKGVPTTKWYVNVHEGAPPNVGAGVICGLVPAAATAAAAAAPAQASPAAGAAAAPGNLPKSGDAVPGSMLFAVLALVGVTLAGTGLVVSRRRA